MYRTPRVTLAGTCLITLIGLVGCEPESEPEPSRDPRQVSALTGDLEPVVAGNNAFALDLYRAAAAEPGNLFFSPFSVSAAFGMTYAGARGTTATEMRSVLDIQTADEAYHAQFGALLADLAGPHPGRGYELQIANRLFGEATMPFLSPYLGVTSGAYGAPLATVDYKTNPQAARGVINDWVATATAGHVPELFKANEIDPLTRLVVANAIYFHANWAKPFDAKHTAPLPFTRADGSKVSVPTMNIDGSFVNGAHDGVSFVEMNYQDDELSMVLLVPDAPDTLDELEAELDAPYLEELLASGANSRVHVSLPRFELKARLPLGDLVKGMGMVTAFDSDAADFSGMADAAESNLYLGKAVHEAFVRVDEVGTEAAAATGVAIEATSAPPWIAADRPFIFLIRDRLTTSILFTGRIADPENVAF